MDQLKIVEKDEFDNNTPMWWALQTDKTCQVSINKDDTKMFWLGYLLRKKILHEDNLKEIKSFNGVQ